jgi:hypothetical protein
MGVIQNALIKNALCSSVLRSPSCAHYLEEGDYIVCDPYWLDTFSPPEGHTLPGRLFGEGDPIGAIVEWYPQRGARILMLHVSEDSADVAVVNSDGKEVGYVAVDSGVIALVPAMFLEDDDRTSEAWYTLTLSEPGWVSYSEEYGWTIGDHALDVTRVM